MRLDPSVFFAVEDIQETTSINLEATRIMESAVSSLTRQIEVLQKEMDSFKVEATAVSDPRPA